ncbi:hypothetical protein V2J09_009090 [Rumex salicifolius]
MAISAATCAERATSDLLITPDWEVNMELCDIINMYPGQAKDALKVIKKRLGNKSPKVQLLALSVLDTLGKNCGENIFQAIIERSILSDMVKIVKKKPDLSVREKILILIDTWQEALGGPGGRHPKFYAAYNELRSAGVVFPPRDVNSVLLFTPPQTHSIDTFPTDEEAAAIQASLQSDPSELSLSEVKNAKGLADVLNEMLDALDPRNSEGLNQEIIVELVEQCRDYRTRVMTLVSSTLDEELLCQGLGLHDCLECVLQRHDDIVKGVTRHGKGIEVAPISPITNVNHEDDESEDEFAYLSHRSGRNGIQGLSKRTRTPKSESRQSPSNMPVKQNGLTFNGWTEYAQSSPPLPLPPSPKRPIITDTSMNDHLSGDTFNHGRSSKTTEPPMHSISNHNNSNPGSLFSPSPPPYASYANSPSKFSASPVYDEPTSTDVSEKLSSPPWESPTVGNLPPPPGRYTQRQQFFEQKTSIGGNHSSSSSGSSYDSLVGQTQNLSLNSPTRTKPKQDDALFKDLVDFVRTRNSPSKASGSRPPPSNTVAIFVFLSNNSLSASTDIFSAT